METEINQKEIHEAENSLYKAKDIAEYIIYLGSLEIGDDKGYFSDGITHLRLQKLLFLSQLHYIIWENKILFDDKIEAWEYGPVIPSVWDEYKEYKGKPIKYKENYLPNILTKKDKDTILKEIWNVYGCYTADILIKILHEHKVWIESFHNSINKTITTEAMKNFSNSIR